MNLDLAFAEKIFIATKRSPFFSRLAVFGAAKLVWYLGFAGLIWSILSGHFIKTLLTILLAWVLQLAIAYLINRRRPFQQEHEKPLMKLSWNTPAFPSGHTTISCAGAAAVFVVAPIWGALFFFVAALVAFCRMAVGVHYLSDIIGGAVLGIGVAVLISKLIV